jgi:hypothetical protein
VIAYSCTRAVIIIIGNDKIYASSRGQTQHVPTPVPAMRRLVRIYASHVRSIERWSRARFPEFSRTREEYVSPLNRPVGERLLELVLEDGGRSGGFVPRHGSWSCGWDFLDMSSSPVVSGPEALPVERRMTQRPANMSTMRAIQSRLRSRQPETVGM